jgi:hypothetical protein
VLANPKFAVCQTSSGSLERQSTKLDHLCDVLLSIGVAGFGKLDTLTPDQGSKRGTT